MKISTLFVSLFLVCIGCNSSKTSIAPNKQNYETLVIEYVANTRGFYQKVVVQNHTVSSTNDRNGQEQPSIQKVSDDDWNFLISEFNKVILDEVPNLKAPTEKRFYDGAAIASLKITFNGKTYETKDFDDGFPPAEIQKVVEIVNILFKAEK
jgi:hypothetical protein